MDREMKANIKTGLVAFGPIFLLAGCSFLSPANTAKDISNAKDEVTRVSKSLENQSAAYASQPVADLTPIEVDRSPAWMHLTVNIDAVHREFDYIVTQVLRSAGVSSQMGEQVSPIHPITSFSYHGSIKGALDRLSALTNFTYTVANDVVVWSAYEGRTFYLPVGGGDYSYMIGKKSDEGGSGSMDQSGSALGGGGSISSSSFDVDRDQFSNTRGASVNPFTDAESAVQAIVGEYGIVKASPATSSIFVKTTPDRMVMVGEFIDGLAMNLSSQVVLDVKVIQVTTETSAEMGVNWKATKDLTRSVLEFDGESGVSNFTNSIPSSFRGIRDTASGSVDVLINALEEHGNVTVLTERRIQTRSGRQAEISLSELRGYVAQSRAIATMDIGTSSEFIQGILQGGTTLYALAHVHGERVSVNLSLRDATIGKIETVGGETSFVQLPNVKANDFKVEAIARSGTTIVSAAIRRQIASDQASSPLRAKLLPTYKGARTAVEDIYVLVTPRIVRL